MKIYTTDAGIQIIYLPHDDNWHMFTDVVVLTAPLPKLVALSEKMYDELNITNVELKEAIEDYLKELALQKLEDNI